MDRTPYRAAFLVVVAPALLLTVPLIATTFGAEFTWTLADFVLGGGIFAGIGGTIELASRTSDNRSYRAALILAVVTASFLFVANAAVGLIGSEDNDANRMYLGALAIAVIGALLVRLRAMGMVRVLVATAIAQVLVAVIALGFGVGVTGPISSVDVVVLTVFFCALWLGSAWLFHQAASEESGR